MTINQPTTPAETLRAALVDACDAVRGGCMPALDAGRERSVGFMIRHLGLTVDEARRAVVLADAGSAASRLRIRATFAAFGARAVAAMSSLGRRS